MLLAPWGVELLGKGLMEPSVEIVYILSPLIVTNSIIICKVVPSWLQLAILKHLT